MNVFLLLLAFFILGFFDGVIERMTIARIINPKLLSLFWVRLVRNVCLCVVIYYWVEGSP